jgi:hypothetical protein
MQMRRFLPLLILAALVVPASSAAVGPRLSVEDRAPFTVRGLGFAPHEKVKVVVSIESVATRWTTAGQRGGFLLRFPALELGYCQGYVIRATGSKGSRALLKLTPECAWPAEP